MDIYALRRAKLAVLVEKTHKGNVSAFAKDYGYSRAQISQFLSETYNNGRSIGERAARALESACRFRRGWLDEPLTNDEMRTLNLPFSTAELRVITDRQLQKDADPLATSDTVARIYIQGRITPKKDGFLEDTEAWRAEATEYIDFFAPSDSTVALQIKSSALRPRFRKSEYLIADSSRIPQPGDDIIVQFTNGSTAVLQLMFARDSETALGSVNDGAYATLFPDDQIEFMSVIIGTLHGSIKTTKERT